MSAPVELTAGWQPPVFSKTPEEKAALRQLLSMHVLFSELPSTDIEVPPLTLVTLPLPLTLTLTLILILTLGSGLGLPLTVAPPPPSLLLLPLSRSCSTPSKACASYPVRASSRKAT